MSGTSFRHTPFGFRRRTPASYYYVTGDLGLTRGPCSEYDHKKYIVPCTSINFNQSSTTKATPKTTPKKIPETAPKTTPKTTSKNNTKN